MAAIPRHGSGEGGSKVDAPSYPVPTTWLRHGWIRLPAIRDIDWLNARFGHN